MTENVQCWSACCCCEQAHIGLRHERLPSEADCNCHRSFPCRSERLSKYNQLLRIEEELGEAAEYAGENWRFIKWESA